MNSGHPALAYLARRKFAGFWRRQVRKLRTPKGALLALLGAGVFALWFGSVVLQSGLRGRSGFNTDADTFEFLSTAGLFAFGVFSVANAFSFRGLYLPPNEIEALFSAPLSRSQLIRHRLATSLARASLGALFFGWMVARIAPRPQFAFFGAVTAFLTLQLTSQAVSLLAGGAENRLADRLAKLPLRWIGFGMLVGLVVLVVNVFESQHDELVRSLSRSDMLERVRAHPATRALALPLTPWTRAMSAQDARQFWPWFTVCLAILYATWWLVPRITVDFRELSLETAADVARRLARARRGLIGNAGSASAHTRSWRTPWLAGRGPFGAAAWRKAIGIVRKARTSFLVGGFIVAVITMGALATTSNDPTNVIAPASIVAGFGTMYLCLGLRFDFREDLDVMPMLRSWPLAPWKLFLATLLPETLLVSGMIAAGVVGVAATRGNWDPALALIVAVVPFVVLAWTAIDNATFLFAPIRMGAGQDGALQNVGRGLIVFLARTVVLLFVFGFAATPLIVSFALHDERTAWTWVLGLVPGFPILIAEIAVLMWAGGEVLRRFDIVRDRA